MWVQARDALKAKFTQALKPTSSKGFLLDSYDDLRNTLGSRYPHGGLVS